MNNVIDFAQHTKNIYSTLADMQQMCDYCLLLRQEEIELSYADVCKMYSCFTNSLFPVEDANNELLAYVKQKFFDVSVQKEIFNAEIEQRGIVEAYDCICDAQENELHSG